MKHNTFLVKPASSLCNLRCRYCFYDDVSSSRACKNMGLLSHEMARELIEKAFAALKQKMDAAAFLCGCKSLFNQFSCHFMGKQSHIFAGSAVGNIVIKAVPATQIAQAGRWLDEKCIMFHRDSLRASQFLKQGYRKIRAFASSNS